MNVLRFIFSKLFICLFTVVMLCVATVFLCLYLHSLLPIAAAICLAWLLSVAAAILMLIRQGAVEFKCAWLAVIIALPVAGAVLVWAPKALAVALFVASYAKLVTGSFNPFIYFRF